MYYLFAFSAGALTLISMITNSKLASYVGTRQSTLVNFTAGLIVSIFLYLMFQETTFKLVSLPIWAYFGGLMGIFIVIISNIVIPKIPTVYTTLLIFIGQLLTGVLIDFIQYRELSLYKFIGVLLITAGLYFNFIIDKKDQLKKAQGKSA
ncbi:MAG TPA: DMT family transporter [Clostridia bacterium]|nr:DMT family transporter [Clostridia bacterium]